MKLLKKLIDKIFKIDFWQVFISNSSIDEFLNTKGKSLQKNYFLIKNNPNSFFADPFLLSAHKNKFSLFVEDFSFYSGAKISFLNYQNKNLKLKKLIVGRHFSYPFNIKDRKKTFLFPEMIEENRNKFYIINNYKITNSINYLLGYKVVDPTIFKNKDLYWLMCSLSGKNLNENSNLYLFYSKQLDGNWISHQKNPIYKRNLNARGAGPIIQHKGKFYRPSQSYLHDNYGSAIMINELKVINKKKFIEKKIFKIKPFKNFEGIHHISYKNNFFAYDQKKTIYSILKPLYYLLKFFR